MTLPLSNEITQSQYGYGEWGLGGTHELAYDFHRTRTELHGIAPKHPTELLKTGGYLYY